jgi:iron(III) transport system substrate-binding protein
MRLIMPGGLDQVTKTWEKVRAWCVSAEQTLRKSVFLRHWWRELAVLGALLLTIAAPFVLKPAQSSVPSRYDRRLVVITPHHEKIRQEFGQAFARKWKERTGETLYIDWRVAGTGDIALTLRSDFAGAFEYYWTHILTKPWSQRVAGAFGNSKVDLSAPTTEANDVEQEARRAFLESDVSVGIDVFFGGGAFDFESQAKAGFLVSSDASKKHGLDAIFERHPDWFVPEVMPQNVSGESFYDKDHRWVGACLSTMGIVYNRDRSGRSQQERHGDQVPGSTGAAADADRH